MASLFGLVIGSFLNVCVHRMPRDISVARPARSFCPECETTIAWYDNVPLFSYWKLGGRCRHCLAAIPSRYPIVEFATGVCFFGFVLWLGPTWQALKLCVFGAILIALVAMDLEERILADEFTLGGMVAGFLFAIVVPVPSGIAESVLPLDLSPRLISLAESVFAAGLLSFVFFAIGAIYQKVRGREGLGLGDVKMVGMIGAFQGSGNALLTVIAGSVLGSVCGLLYILFTRQDASTYELPFGSFLGVAALLVAVWVLI